MERPKRTSAAFRISGHLLDKLALLRSQQVDAPVPVAVPVEREHWLRYLRCHNPVCPYCSRDTR